MIGTAHALVVYRVLAAALFNSTLLFQEEHVTTATVVTGALVHYVAIVIMTKVAGGGVEGAQGGISSEAPGKLSGLPSCRSTSMWPSSSVTLVRGEASSASWPWGGAQERDRTIRGWVPGSLDPLCPHRLSHLADK